MRAAGHILVLGSLNVDFVAYAERLPAAGETVAARAFHTFPGGKGANQAWAAARLERPGAGGVKMGGRVGYDHFGDQLKAGLASGGVDVTHVAAAAGVHTGTALITVDGNGQNAIAVAAGANARMDAAAVSGMRAAFGEAVFVALQLETPLEGVRRAIELARAEGVPVVLDPAPAMALDAELLAGVDWLTPNELEAAGLLGGAGTAQDPAQSAAKLRAMGPRRVVLKLGPAGCFYSGPDGELAVPGFRVDAVDATAAGDTFNAALLVALREGLAPERALRFANAAAALSTTKTGAQSSVPLRADVDSLMGDV
jgi:ribokinase